MPTEIENLSVRISSDATKASKAIDDIVSSLGKLKSVSAGLDDIGKVTSLISGLKELNGVKLSPSIAKQLVDIGVALEMLPKDDRITELVRALGKFGEVAGHFTGLATNIKALSKLIGEPLSTDNMDKVAEATAKVAKETDKAIAKMSQFNDVVNETESKSSFIPTMINRDIPKMVGEKSSDWTTGPSKNTDAIQESLPVLTELQNKLYRIGMAGLISEQATNEFRTAISGLVNVTKTFAPVISTATSKTIEFGFVLARGVLKVGLAGFKQLGKAIGSALSPMKRLVDGAKNLFRSVARIAGYRAIRTFIKLITEGLKEGIDTMYLWSKEMGGQFAKSMDTIATKTHYIGRSLSAMLAPLINLAAVILEQVTPAFVGMINTFNKFLATLTGQDYYTVAVEDLVEYGDTITDAADRTGRAAKEIRDAVIGIDELNIISQNTGSGSGSIIDPENSFVDEVLNKNEEDSFAAKLNEAITNQDWAKVGRTIAEKINSIFTADKAKELGSKVGTFIKNGLALVSNLLSETDFKGIGSSIAGFLNSVFDSFDDSDAYNLGQTLANAITALPKAAVGFMTDLNWSDVGNKLGSTLGGLLGGLADFINETEWDKLGAGLADGIIALFSNEKFLSNFQDLIISIPVAGIRLVAGAIFTTVVESAVEEMTEMTGNDPDLQGFIGLLTKGEKYTPFEEWLEKNGYSGGTGNSYFKDDAYHDYEHTSVLYSMFLQERRSQTAAAESVTNWVGDVFTKSNISEDYWEETSEPYTTKVVKGLAKGLVSSLRKIKGSSQEDVKKWTGDVVTKTNISQDYWDDAAEPIVKGVTSIVKKAFDAGKGKAEALNLDAQKALKHNVDQIIAFVDPTGKTEELVQKAYNAATGKVDELKEDGKKALQSDVDDVIKGVNPEPKALDVGVTIVKGMDSGIKKEKETFRSTLSSVVKSGLSVISATAKQDYDPAGGNIVTKIRTGLSGQKESFKTAVVSLMETGHAAIVISDWKTKAKNVVVGFNDGIEANKESTVTVVKKWMTAAGNAASIANLEGSPSKLYAEKAKNVILGFNNEIKRDGYTTENAVTSWMKSVQQAVPVLTYSTAVDPSVLNKYTSGAVGSLDTSLSTQSTLIATGFEEGMERFYMTYLMPVLNQIALDTTTTANKPDPVIEIDGRTLARTVNTQNRVNGYSFS